MIAKLYCARVDVITVDVLASAGPNHSKVVVCQLDGITLDVLVSARTPDCQPVLCQAKGITLDVPDTLTAKLCCVRWRASLWMCWPLRWPRRARRGSTSCRR